MKRFFVLMLMSDVGIMYDSDLWKLRCGASEILYFEDGSYAVEVTLPVERGRLGEKREQTVYIL